MEDLILALMLFMIFCPIGYIYQAYIKGPGKTIREGLLDWYHESDGDI